MADERRLAMLEMANEALAGACELIEETSLDSRELKGISSEELARLTASTFEKLRDRLMLARLMLEIVQREVKESTAGNLDTPLILSPRR